MKAVQIHQYGGPEELNYEEAPMPEIQADEVLVKIYATSINPIDWKVRQGSHGNYQFPLILGWDAAGTVEEVGEQVTTFKAGDAVYGRPDVTRNGTYAEYVAVKADQLALKPERADFLTAAAIPLAGLTAWQGIFDHGQLQAGQKILIHGGSGGVGTFAIQFAKWKGAHVATTASESNIQFLKDLGADEVINYKTEQFEEKLTGYDVVFDTIGGDTQLKSVQVLKQGGILVSTVGIANPDALKEKNIEGKQYMAQSYPDQLKQIGELLDAGKIQPIITKVFPLNAVAEAQKASEQGHTRGKIVVQVINEPEA
ncbi:NADP-dependent oxidoreductase [Mucilaginibacter koreensis]